LKIDHTVHLIEIRCLRSNMLGMKGLWSVSVIASILILGTLGLSSIPGYASFLTPVEIIDATGDGGGNTLDAPFDIATDSSGNVFVTGFDTDNAFKITPGGTITEIIDATGDGGGNVLDGGFGVATDSSGNVFVVGDLSENAFKIEPEKKSCDVLDKASEKGQGQKKGLERSKSNNNCN